MPQHLKQGENMKILISPVAFLKMRYLLYGTDEEVQAFLIGENKKRLYIEDLLVLEQEVSGTSTEVDNYDISKFMINEIKKGNKKTIEKVIGTWHSHVNMGCFWSGEDEDNIERLGSSIDCVVCIVSSRNDNNGMEIKCRVDLFRPFRTTVDDVKYEVDTSTIIDKILNTEIKSIRDDTIELSSGIKLRISQIIMEDEKIKKECEKEIQDKCKKIKYEQTDYFGLNRYYKYGYGYPRSYANELVEIEDGIFVKYEDVRRIPMLEQMYAKHIQKEGYYGFSY